MAWLRELVGYGPESFGVLTSGGVMANVMALTVARDIGLARLLGRSEPPRGSALEGVRAYVSDQAHFSIARGLDVLGFPPETLRVLPSDERFRLRGASVAAAIADDRAAGLTPWLIAAVTGSTNTGSVDLTDELAAVAERDGLWLHVDAAYGGAVRLSAREAWRVPALDRADSVTLDPHKWFFQPYDIGGLLVKRRDDLRQTFHRSPEYYRTSRPEDEPLHWYQYSLEGTRRFRALKLWLTWKSLGTEGLGRLVEGNLALAAHLARRCRESDDFEAMPEEPELSVVCFRHVAWRSCGRRAARSHGARGARPPPGPAPARARGLRRRLGFDHPAARRHLAARGDRQLPRHRGGHRPAAGDIAAAGGGAVARRTFGPRRSRRIRHRGSGSAASGRSSCRDGWSRSPPGRPAPGRPPRAAR